MNKVGRPLKYKSVEEMQLIIDNYFKECDEKQKPYTITGLALALDMTRLGLINYENKDEFMNTIKKAKLKVEGYAEEQLYKGGNTAGVIFSLKNNYNWVDKQEIKAEVDQDITINIDIEE